MTKKTKGFTLIELLIVIGILGILAAGLLAAIDPLEQLKKGRDNQRRSISVELSNAILRYYAVFGTMPWGTTATALSLSQATAAGNIVPTLTDVGELKSTFSQGIPGGMADQISILGGETGAGVAVCFDPESKSISADPTTIFTATTAYPPPTTSGTCTAADTCYFCVTN